MKVSKALRGLKGKAVRAAYGLILSELSALRRDVEAMSSAQMQMCYGARRVSESGIQELSNDLVLIRQAIAAEDRAVGVACNGITSLLDQRTEALFSDLGQIHEKLNSLTELHNYGQHGRQEISKQIEAVNQDVMRLHQPIWTLRQQVSSLLERQQVAADYGTVYVEAKGGEVLSVEVEDDTEADDHWAVVMLRGLYDRRELDLSARSQVRMALEEHGDLF